jgi:hypothetical protein
VSVGEQSLLKLEKGKYNMLYKGAFYPWRQICVTIIGLKSTELVKPQAGRWRWRYTPLGIGYTCVFVTIKEET